jgi:signal transduction histidine kinase/ActR/RegA family two-component response regulator
LQRGLSSARSPRWDILPAVAIDLPALLEHTRDLQRATTVQELLAVTRTAVRAAAGYDNVWLAVFEEDMVRLLATSGNAEAVIWEQAPRFPAAEDRMLDEIRKGTHPVVVTDARVDPRTNKDLVGRLGNRTIINVPLLLGEANLGCLGAGTFGDEGVRPPSEAALEMLGVMATHVAAALQRVRMLEEHRVAERDREQLRRRLMSVQRIESLALLAGGIAHDFNNLLTVISNSVRFAQEHAVVPEQQADLDGALDAAERAAALTRQLLAMGRQQSLHLQQVQVNPLLHNMVTMLRRLFPENVTTDLIPGAQLPSVSADSSQLDQVFMNLCLNARDAMPSGGRLTIETEQVVINGPFIEVHPWAKAGRYVLVTVNDTGHGMSPEVQERVFEPFFTTKPATSGTGLGLAVAAGVVEQHGGMIHCYSEVGVGTTFKVYLPILARRAHTVGTKILSDVPRGHERILLAEDDPSVQKVATRILTRAGYSVLAVNDGRAAIDAALAESFDLVVLDAVMPVATGRDAYDRIHAACPRSAFLFASGHSRDVLPSDMLAAAGIELVDKPYHPDDLLRAVRRALDQRPDPLVG